MKILRKIFTPKILGLIAFVIAKLLHFTFRYKSVNVEVLESNTDKTKGCIFALWHQDLLATATYGQEQSKRNKIYNMTSRSRDGEIVSAFFNKMGFGTIRGSSSRGALSGLKSMIDVLKAGNSVCVAVDGPRGPIYEAKPGVILLAKKSGRPIIPFAAKISNKIILHSWDRCEIPMPFAKCTILFGNPIFVDENADSQEIEAKKIELENILKSFKSVK